MAMELRPDGAAGAVFGLCPWAGEEAYLRFVHFGRARGRMVGWVDIYGVARLSDGLMLSKNDMCPRSRTSRGCRVLLHQPERALGGASSSQ